MQMETFLQIINANSGAINLLFSLAVASATVFYAVLTHRLVSETKRMREVQTEPALSIWIEPSEHGVNFINLVIENSGQGSAHSIALTSVPNFQRFREKYLADLGLFKHGIKHLAPRQRITFFLTSILEDVHGHDKDLGRLDFTVEARYSSSIGRMFADTFPIHFESFEGFGTIGTPPLISIAQDIDKIQKDIGRIASGFNKLQVVVSTQRDVAREHEAMFARYATEGAEQADEAVAVPEVAPAPSAEATSTGVPASEESEHQ